MITHSQLLAFAKKSIAVWRKRWRIDEKWDISVVYSSEPDVDDPKIQCWNDQDRAQYWKMRLVFYPPALEPKSDTTIRTRINQTVCHEMGHIFHWPMGSFAENVLSKSLYNEYLKHEESLVTLQEEIFTNQKLKQGVKLTWGNDANKHGKSKKR